MAYVLLARLHGIIMGGPEYKFTGNIYYLCVLSEYYIESEFLCVCVLIGVGMPHQLTADWRCLRVECHGGEDMQNLAQELQRVVINGISNWS
jgi:hypothetical protein